MYKITVTRLETQGQSHAAARSNMLPDASFLQSEMWCNFKARHGWKNLRFFIEVEEIASPENEATGSTGKATLKFDCSVLVRSFAKNIFSLAYIPMITLPAENSDGKPLEHVREHSEFLCEFTKAIKKYLPQNTICVRYDLPVDFATVAERDFFNASVMTLAFADKLPLRKNKVDIQPPDTVVLDITRSEEDILAGMKNKWRYNVRLAQKKGVEVKVVTATDAPQKIDEALEVFYTLYKTTAERDGIAIHAQSYYRDLFALCAQMQNDALQAELSSASLPPLVSIYTAFHEGEALAAIITLFTQNEAVYLYGASSNVKRNLMPAYLLQWTAICDAKKFGAKAYDFYGIPPTDDETHPMHGLYLFKTGFGGAEVHRPGSYDVPASPLYAPYTVAENARAFFFKKIKKIFKGR